MVDQPTQESVAGFVIAVLLLVALAAAGLYDAWVIVGRSHPVTTVSELMIEWSHRYPIFTVAIGFILGHLFFPTKG